MNTIKEKNNLEKFFGTSHMDVIKAFNDLGLSIPKYLENNTEISSKIIFQSKKGNAELLKDTLVICGFCNNDEKALQIANQLTSRLSSPIKQDLYDILIENSPSTTTLKYKKN